MAKLNTPKGKLVRKLGVNIFGNPKFDRLLSKKGYGPGPVSYTHLTLPTILLV